MNGKTHFKILYFSQETVSKFDTHPIFPTPSVSIFDTPKPATEMAVSKIDTPNPSTVLKIDTLPIFPIPSVSIFDTPKPTTEVTVSKIDTLNPSTVSKIDTHPIFPTPSVSKIDTPEPVTEVTVSKFDTLNPSTVSKIDTRPIFPTPSVSIFDTPTPKNTKTVSNFDTAKAVNNNNNITKEIIIINPKIENSNLEFLFQSDFKTKVAIQLKNPNYASGLIHEFQNKNSHKAYEDTFKAEQHFWNWLSKVRDNYAYQTKCHDIYQTVCLNQAKEKWLQIAADIEAIGFDNSPILTSRIKKQDANKIIVEVPSPNTIEQLEEEPLFPQFFKTFKKYFGEKTLLEYELKS
jgi:hypothetical protein